MTIVDGSDLSSGCCLSIKFGFNLKVRQVLSNVSVFYSRKTMLKSMKYSCLKDGNPPSVKTQG